LNPTFLYVGAIYAVAVALARRGGNPLPKRIAVLFYALVLVFLFKAMTGPYVCIATDIPKLIAPWSASAPGLTKYTVLNMETHDVPMQLVPWAHQVREAWKSALLEAHPDRVLARGLPAEFAEVAHAKSAAINAAYDTIMRQRKAWAEQGAA